MASYEPRLLTLPGKHPDEELSYSLDFQYWSAAASLTLDSCTVGSGITLLSSGATGLVVTFKLGGGTSGDAYTVTVQVTDADGEVYVVIARVSVFAPS
jgi:hypothetical protein